MSPLSIAGVVDTLRRVTRHADGNAVGQAYGLTVFTPIVAGQEASLQRHLEDLPVGSESPLARLDQLHCARLHVLRELVYQGAPQAPEPLASAYLIFSASFDGERDEFLGDLCTELAGEADAVWGHCVGYPGTDDPADFCRWFEHNQIDNHYFLSPYPDSTVREVRDALALRARVAEFAAGAQGMDARSLRDGFRETFGA